MNTNLPEMAQAEQFLPRLGSWGPGFGPAGRPDDNEYLIQPVQPHDVVVNDLLLRRRREPGEVLL
jgi:hypothetical protein